MAERLFRRRPASIGAATGAMATAGSAGSINSAQAKAMIAINAPVRKG
jgi:hypothetical protein